MLAVPKNCDFLRIQNSLNFLSYFRYSDIEKNTTISSINQPLTTCIKLFSQCVSLISLMKIWVYDQNVIWNATSHLWSGKGQPKIECYMQFIVWEFRNVVKTYILYWKCITNTLLTDDNKLHGWQGWDLRLPC